MHNLLQRHKSINQMIEHFNHCEKCMSQESDWKKIVCNVLLNLRDFSDSVAQIIAFKIIFQYILI